jgi:hypothetical protein
MILKKNTLYAGNLRVQGTMAADTQNRKPELNQCHPTRAPNLNKEEFDKFFRIRVAVNPRSGIFS